MGRGYHIKNRIDIGKWSQFLLSHPKGNIFQSPEIFDVYSNTLNYKPLFLAVVDDTGLVLGILLAVIQKEHKGILGTFSSRSLIIGGPVIKDDHPDVLKILLSSYLDEIQGKAIYTQVRNVYDTDNLKASFMEAGFTFEPHLDIIIDLDQPTEELIRNIHKGKRRNLTKSENKGTEFVEITDLQSFNTTLSLVYRTYKRVKLPVPDRSLFTHAFVILQSKGLLHAFAAVHENKTIGIRIELTYKDLIYDWYAGSDDSEKNKYPNDFLPYKILLWGKEKGYRRFDFGGAGKPNEPYGVREHKMKFGGAVVEYGRFEKIHIKLLMKIGKLGIKIYKYLK